MMERRPKYSSENLIMQIRQRVHSATGDFAKINRADIVVGIPFYDEADTIGHVIELAVSGFKKHYPDKKAALLCVGSPEGGEALKRIRQVHRAQTYKVPIHSFLLGDRRLNGRGWSIRAMMEYASELHAHLIVLSADLLPGGNDGDKGGFGPDWIKRLADPVLNHEIDLVLPRYVHHYLDCVVQSHLAYPLITATFGTRIRQPISGEYGISYKLLRMCLREYTEWFEDSGTYGFDPWLTTTAIVSGAQLSEVGMGLKFHKPNPGKIKMTFFQTAGALFEQIVAKERWWRNRDSVITNVDSIGVTEDGVPQRVALRYRELIAQFRADFNRYHNPLLSRILPEDIYEQLETRADSSPEKFYLSGADWARAVNAFLIAYSFGSDFAKCDVLNGLYPVFLGRLASFTREIEELKECLDDLPVFRADRILRGETERKIAVQTDQFIRYRPELMDLWDSSEAAQKPYLPQLGSWEFIPNVGVVVPQEIPNKDGEPVHARDIYRTLIDRYRDEFREFVHDRLDVPEDAGSEQILAQIRQLMLKVEEDLGTTIIPGSLRTVKGTQKVADAIMNCVPHRHVYALKESAAYRIIRHYVPRNLVTILPCTDLAGLLEMYDARDSLALAGWTEDMEYKERLWNEIEKSTPEDFERVPVKLLVVDHKRFETLANLSEASGPSWIVGRIIIGTLPKGKGGEFPRLRYFLSICRHLLEGEVFGDIWAQFAAEEVDFGPRLVASKKGHWGRRILSAHNMFENIVQRMMVERLREVAATLPADVADHLEAVADSYHLSLTMPDARFIPCSAWTWASYSFRGGQGYPTPLSVLVERDWAHYDFIVSYMKATGIGDETTLRRRIVELMGEGRESEDLREHLFGMTVDAIEIPVRQLQKTRYNEAKKMSRPVEGPILEPIADHYWESQYVLNCAAVRLDGTIYILYRAFGDDKMSRMGLAWTTDGCHIDGRLDRPVYEPGADYETHGCEDPRVTVIGDQIYMLYTAFNGEIAQIAMACIGKDDFLAEKWDKWERLGLGFPGVHNKDAVLYPEKIEGKYAIYHRIDPNMWISYTDTLECPWPRTEHRL